MALIVETKNPAQLLTAIKKSIDSNSIQTWSYDNDGDFTHTPEQWVLKGWMRPIVRENELQFLFLGERNELTTKLIYAVYHGRFAEMLLSHFDKDFKEVKATALPISGDKITTSKI